MSVFWMKVLALVSMITDHVGVFLYPGMIARTPYRALRGVGRSNTAVAGAPSADAHSARRKSECLTTS